ncbi:MAG: PH domain-containing protein [Acidimicrobiia bacterium]|nr:PH domain-containing protein [Acidimicrobiia bacterium]
MQRLPESVQRLWRIGGVLIGGLFGLVVSSLVAGSLVAIGPPTWIYWLSPLPIPAAAGIGFWWAGVKFRNWGWQITDRWIEAKHGVLGHYRVVIPRNRIQTVTTNSGPIDRMLDLETITVHTAGAGAPNLTIPHLSTQTVGIIRSELGHGVHG